MEKKYNNYIIEQELKEILENTIDFSIDKNKMICKTLDFYFKNNTETLQKIANLYILENRIDLYNYYYFKLSNYYEKLYKQYQKEQKETEKEKEQKQNFDFTKIFKYIAFVLFLPIMFLYFFIIEISKNQK